MISLVIDQSQPGVFYLQKMMNFMKMRTFYKKLPLFTKNSILHTYKKLKPQIWALQKTPFLELIETPGSREVNTSCWMLIQSCWLPFCRNHRWYNKRNSRQDNYQLSHIRSKLLSTKLAWVVSATWMNKANLMIFKAWSKWNEGEKGPSLVLEDTPGNRWVQFWEKI